MDSASAASTGIQATWPPGAFGKSRTPSRLSSALTTGGGGAGTDGENSGDSHSIFPQVRHVGLLPFRAAFRADGGNLFHDLHGIRVFLSIDDDGSPSSYDWRRAHLGHSQR